MGGMRPGFFRDDLVTKMLMQVFLDGKTRMDELGTIALTDSGFEGQGTGKIACNVTGKMKPHVLDRPVFFFWIGVKEK
jgi:hypothetical protein